eukprot:c25809_g1_i1 orf=472-2022(-)
MAARHKLRKLGAHQLESCALHCFLSEGLYPVFVLPPECSNFWWNSLSWKWALHWRSIYGRDDKLSSRRGYCTPHGRGSQEPIIICFDRLVLDSARAEEPGGGCTNRIISQKLSYPSVSESFRKTGLNHGHLTEKVRGCGGLSTRLNFAPLSSLQECTFGFAARRNGGFRATTLPWSCMPVFGRPMICEGSGFVPKLVRFLSNEREDLQDQIGGLQASFRDVSQSTTQAGITENLGSSVSEVGAAVADCSYPTAFLQLLIENVHLQAALPWWAAIAFTTIAARLICVPVVIYQMKAGARFALIRPELEQIMNRIKESGYEQMTVLEGRKRTTELYRKNQTSPFAPFIGALIQAPLFMCFFFAVRNMAQRVESFKEGGALWFTDLSTPDSTYILPLLMALSLWITIELGAMEGMEGNPTAVKAKQIFRLMAAVSVPVSASFEKALFFYWLTSNLWSLCQAYVLRRPVIKNTLGIIDIPNSEKQATSVEPIKLFTQRRKKVSIGNSASKQRWHKSLKGK